VQLKYFQAEMSRSNGLRIAENTKYPVSRPAQSGDRTPSLNRCHSGLSGECPRAVMIDVPATFRW